MRTRILLVAVAVAACDDGTVSPDECSTATDCPAERPVCDDGRCVAAASDAAPDAAGDAAADAAQDGAVRDAARDGAAPDAAADAVPPDMGRDAALPPDALPDVPPPDPRAGHVGEACARGFELDCDPDTTDRCVFVGADNEVIPGVEAVCSRACESAEDCGAGQCCFPDPQGAYCLPAGFCAGFRSMGEPCVDASECPADAPLCALDAATGSRFCTHGCAAGGACEEGFCCDANAGGRPAGAICKPLAICPMPCESDDDCPAVQYCDEGACVPRRFVCDGDAECPRGERCINGSCRGRVARLGEPCGEPGVRCADAAPVCFAPDEGAPFCTYNCTFHRDCPATFCCADLAGLNDPSGFYCTDDPEVCPPNLPCDGDEDCGADQFCHQGLCQERGPQDIPVSGACQRPGECVPEAVDCVFPFGAGHVGRGDARNFPAAGPGICSARCTRDDQCGAGECCRIAVQIRHGVGAGFCVRGDVCETPVAPVGEACARTADCDPASSDRCFEDRLFGHVCGRPCGGGCPDGTVCDVRDDLCHPENICESDDDCAPGNRCARGRCLEGRRECTVDTDCEDPVALRCFDGRCDERARPCEEDGDCDPSTEVCFAGQCELRNRPCAADDDCRAGEACHEGICGEVFLQLGEACVGAEFGCDPESAPICLEDDGFAPDGVCTRACAYDSDCPGDFCCFDSTGLADPEFFMCGPPEACADRAVVERRPCASDDDCLAEDFCHRGLCEDRGARDAAPGEACVGPGDCDLDAADQCVVPLEFGFGAGAVSSHPDAIGAGTCQPACVADADCGTGCCRHAVENGAPVAFCVPAEACPPAGGPGDPCFPGAHDECDPSSTDACIFAAVSETTYCAAACDEDVDCGVGCCGPPAGADGRRYCLQPADCP